MKRYEELVKNYNGEVYDLCYELLNEGGDDAEIFEYACKNFGIEPSSKQLQLKEHFSKEEIEKYVSVYGDTVNGLLNSTIKKCNLGVIEPNDFYRTLWSAFCNNFKTEKEKAFALYYTLIDKSIPYRYLGTPISMSNERYSQLAKNNVSAIDQIKYILRSGYTQRTEIASLILNCLNGINDFESRSVVMSHALEMYSMGKSHLIPKELDKLIQQIDQRIDELEEEHDDTDD